MARRQDMARAPSLKIFLQYTARTKQITYALCFRATGLREVFGIQSTVRTRSGSRRQ